MRDIVDLEDSKRVPLSNAQRAGRKGNYPYYGATGIMDYIDDFIFDYDILLLAEDGSTSDANGFPVVQYVWGKVWVNNHAHIILPKDRDHLVYTYFLLKGIPIKLIETGSIQKKISQDNLLVYKTLNAPKYIRDIYTERMSALWEQKKLATEEIMQLTKQRDELLPLLMNGQAS
ncbi:restriction endonuclease subunit S, partial [Porphyromonas macacae]|uniref:restriction endonuclease subunit S n=1 Tax=Porphyromonas macacae TaxID=28115 RepID=UPI003F9B837F